MCGATYLDMGLSVFPCMGEDGKKPCVKWGSLQKRPIGSKGLDKWLAAFAGANIAIVTGKLSGITVIDCDNPDISIIELFEIYGETPLIAKTPSGGIHLYYKYNGEGTAAGIAPKIDIRGEGGVIIAPPSYNRKTGALYYFIEGDIWDIGNLPVMKNNSAIQWKYNEKQREYNEGERNTNLYYYLLGEAINCPDVASLTEIAESFNNEFMSPPEDDNKQIAATVAQVWKYKKRGTLGGKHRQHLTISMQKLNPIKFKHSKAFAMYIDLLSCHSGINKIFAICPKAYAKRCGWSANTIRQELQTLLMHGFIKQVYKGGKYKGDVSQFILS